MCVCYIYISIYHISYIPRMYLFIYILGKKDNRAIYLGQEWEYL